LQKAQGWGTRFSLWEEKNKPRRRLGHPPETLSDIERLLLRIAAFAAFGYGLYEILRHIL